MVIPLLSSFHQKCFLSTNLLSSGVVLDELAILHVVASTHPVDLLVHLSPVKKSITRGKYVYMSQQSFSSVCLKVYYQTPPMNRRGVSESFRFLLQIMETLETKKRPVVRKFAKCSSVQTSLISRNLWW